MKNIECVENGLKTKPDGLDERMQAMRDLAKIHTASLMRFLRLPREKRMSGKKRDRTDVTILDYETNLKTLRRYLGKFPDDSFDGEEIHMLREDADWTLLEDPIDATNHAMHYDRAEPDKKCWPTYMLSLLFKGAPVAFALGVPLKKRIVSGNIWDGAEINGEPTEAFISSSITLRSDGTVSGELEELGGQNLHIAGLCAWLIVKSDLRRGTCPFTLPHESACIAACARSLGARITDQSGGPFRPYNEQSRLVWKFVIENGNLVP